MPDKLSEKYPEISQQLCNFFNCTEAAISIVKTFSEGKSGDTVLLLTVNDAADSSAIGDYVLKIGANGGEKLSEEISNTVAAGRQLEGSRIMIPEIRTFCLDQPAFYLYDVAGNDIIRSTSLAQMDSHNKAVRLSDLLERLQYDWNDKFTAERASIRELIVNWLGEDRLGPDSRLSGRIREFITDELSAYFRYEGEILPNPLVFCCNPNGIFSSAQAVLQNALFGKMHGDLNVNNVIVQMMTAQKGYQFYLIDFEQYRTQAPLLFDYAYLFLNILLDDTTDFSLSEWYQHVKTYLESLFGGTEVPNTKEYAYMKAVQGPIDSFIHRRQEHNKRCVQLQELAAHIAAGLNFANKRGSNERRQLFSFMYAAVATQVLLKALEYTESGTPEAPCLQVGQKLKSTNVWKELGGFSSDNRYILISNCGNGMESDTLINLAPVRWNMVIEINDMTENPVRTEALQHFKQTLGYRFEEVPRESGKIPAAEPTWLHVNIPLEKTNAKLYYRRELCKDIEKVLETVLSIRQNESLYIVLDPKDIDCQIYNQLISDIIIAAGKNTPVHIVSLGESGVDIANEDTISYISVECTLQLLGNDVYALLENRTDKHEVHLPGKNGIKRVPAEMDADLSNDMVLVHHGMTIGLTDDGGENFYRGGEVSWVDIASSRDIIRLDYRREWFQTLKAKLDGIPAGASSIINLRHKAGGGGTTLSKRIAWEFSSLYPTVILQTISPQTAERLKGIYDMCVKPLLIIAEVNDGRITSEGINGLRRTMLPKGIRALFLCVSRLNSTSGHHNSENFYLPDTADMNMSTDESEMMLRRFTDQLQQDDENRIHDLSLLTYDEEYRELRQPFFYGLYTYGDHYLGIQEFVLHNSDGINKEERNTLDMLALITAYSQSVSFTVQDIASFLRPGERPDLVQEEVKTWVQEHCLVVRHENGFRICHPIIAHEILRQSGITAMGDGEDKLVRTALSFIDTLVAFYGAESERLNCIFREIFTHRDVIDDEESMKFSQLITRLGTRERAVKVMSHLEQTIPHNPHYSNHLSRIYLYQIGTETTFPDILNATKYAQEAIARAQNSDTEGTAIHYHALGKVYTQQCVGAIKKATKKMGDIGRVLKEAEVPYRHACDTFDACIANDRSGYGLTGKLELISKILNTLRGQYHNSINGIIGRASAPGTEALREMIAVAGDVITRYHNEFDSPSGAFRTACIHFYQSIDSSGQLEMLLKARTADTFKQKVLMRRALSSIYLQRGMNKSGSISYDALTEESLKKIYNLMAENLDLQTASNQQDRVRWLETYRRLPEFSLNDAYQFLMAWPDANDNIFVCYYRFIVSFALYCRTGAVNYEEVRKHLRQCEQLSRNAYGKNITASLNYFGYCEEVPEYEILVPRPMFDPLENKETRTERHIAFRKQHCQWFRGNIASIHDGLITIRFQVGDNSFEQFEAKAPNDIKIPIEKDGMPISFRLGFSYSGFRAWDLELDV